MCGQMKFSDLIPSFLLLQSPGREGELWWHGGSHRCFANKETPLTMRAMAVVRERWASPGHAGKATSAFGWGLKQWLPAPEGWCVVSRGPERSRVCRTGSLEDRSLTCSLKYSLCGFKGDLMGKGNQYGLVSSGAVCVGTSGAEGRA